MGIIKPATPGFLVTLIATILLAVVSFSVPWFKSVFFLKVSLSVEGISGNMTFGVLGYCIEIASGTTCSSPTIGYSLDVNKLVGNSLPVNIPNAVVKWLTYALVLHIVALGLAAGSAVFGLLAHVREMSMTCCSTCISGMAAVVAMVAFGFDLAFFFVAKARINAVKGGSATMGNAIWLTFAAWALLFFSGCFYSLGRCCIRRRPGGDRGGGSSMFDRNNNNNNNSYIPPKDDYAEQMRMEAIRAEADRKARQNAGEGGLPKFHEYDEEDHPSAPYHDDHYVAPATGAGAYGYGRRPSQGTSAPTGYVQAPLGTRAVDEYNTPPGNQQATYPPRRQDSAHSAYTYGASTTVSSPPPMPNQYLAAAPGQYADPYANAGGQGYGHAAGGTSYYSAHEQTPSQYSPYENVHTAPAPAANYYPEAAIQQHHPERGYTLGGGGYGENSVPPLQSPHDNTRAQMYEDSPPGYDGGVGNVPAWNGKR